MWDALWNEAVYYMQMIHCYGMGLDVTIFFQSNTSSCYTYRYKIGGCMSFAQSSTAFCMDNIYLPFLAPSGIIL